MAVPMLNNCTKPKASLATRLSELSAAYRVALPRPSVSTLLADAWVCRLTVAVSAPERRAASVTVSGPAPGTKSNRVLTYEFGHGHLSTNHPFERRISKLPRDQTMPLVVHRYLLHIALLKRSPEVSDRKRFRARALG